MLAMSSIFSDGAKKTLLDSIKRKGALSLEEAIKGLALAKTTVRQHLLSLEEQGFVQRKYESHGQGRPKVLFELTDKAQALYPTQEPELLRELLEFLKESGQLRSVELFFQKYWEKRKSQFTHALQQKLWQKSEKQGTSEQSSPKNELAKNELKMRIETLRALLQAEGFMPEFKQQKQSVEVKECHCPFPEAIRATQIPCKLESEFIQWALKTPMERTSYFPQGDLACAYRSRVNTQRKPLK